MTNYTQFTYAYSKRRQDFGKQPLFQVVPGHLLDSINPDKQHQKLYGLRNPVHREVQATAPQSEHDACTKQVEFYEQGINHTEGGWPREVHLDNEDHVHRHCRRILHEENYIHSVMSLAPQMEHYLDQNNAIDMYQTYFANMRHQEPVEKYNIREENVFRDPFHRPVSCIVWTNEKKSKLAVSYCRKFWSGDSERKELNACYLWDVTRQTAPVNEMTPNSSCCQLACSPIDPEIIIAGLENGTVNVFDIRQGKESVACSSEFNSHQGPVSSLLYTHSRTETEFFTGSPDGTCLWWDSRNFSKPMEQLIMSIRIPPGEIVMKSNAEGVSSLEYDRGFPTKFLCGTESGFVINVNRMGREHSEVLSSYWTAHDGPVRAVHRSPCTLRMFVTCGDWSVRVWSEEVRTAPIIVTKPYRYQVADVSWAPLRYSCYMSICEGGYFYYWDFLRKYREPVATLQISEHALTKVTPYRNGSVVAVGDVKGSVYLVQLSENMTIPGDNDKQLMFQVYERETKREHHLDTRLKEIRLKIREEEEHIVKQENVSIGSHVVETVDNEEGDRMVEEDYFKIIAEELLKMDSTPTSNDFL